MRNPDVVAEEFLLRANGICERCGKDAPFKRKARKTPNLTRGSSQMQLAKGGEDTEKRLGLVSNCHRYSHFGPEPDEFVEYVEN
ncbi:MAG: hypothetical protein IPN81_14340 [Nitrosomonadales bacterium]|nr:hypothetical protein [Nitrosomonadales bacterium]